MQVRNAVKWLLLLASMTISINATAMKDLENHAVVLEKMRMSGFCDPQQVEIMEEKINSARKIAASLNSELVTYRTERAQYNETLSALRSALFASVLAALGIVGGWIVSSLNAKADRDLKRLNIIEKAGELREAGFSIPSDIEAKYLSVSMKKNTD